MIRVPIVAYMFIFIYTVYEKKNLYTDIARGSFFPDTLYCVYTRPGLKYFIIDRCCI